MKLWFKTHSTTIDNERGIASRHLDAPLSPLGEIGVQQQPGIHALEPGTADTTSDQAKRHQKEKSVR